MHKFILSFYCLLLFANSMFAQAIDNTASYRNINNNSYVRLHYDNDFFSATDRYYSQGVNLEIVHPSIQKFPLSKILLHSKNSDVKYGIAMVHDVYTPSSIRHREIFLNDRPYSANWMLNTFCIALDSLGKSRTTSSFSIGVLGTVAGGADMQTSIHRWLDNIEPLGWKHQIRSDVAINYSMQYERLLVSYKKLVAVSTNVNARVGTLNDKVGVGLNVLLGYFENPFGRISGNPDFRFHFYGQSVVSVIGYDANLQGGMFNRSSPYTISASQLSRVTLQHNYGLVFHIKKLYLEYSRGLLNKEFKTGLPHGWGGIKIGCAF